MLHAVGMQALRTVLLIVFLIGSGPGPAAHALRMAHTFQAPVAAAEAQTKPPCHHGQMAAGAHHDNEQSPAARDENRDCCQSGHCDCAHVSPAAAMLPVIVNAIATRSQSASPSLSACSNGVIDTPLRPPSR
jgi:hypothetical protein